MKKLLAGKGGWTCVKKVLGWILDTEAGTVTLPERKLEEHLTLVDIPAALRRMGQKDLDCLVGKLRYMHLAVPGLVAHLFHIQRALNQGGVDRVWLSSSFYPELADCQRTWRKLSIMNPPIWSSVTPLG